MADDALLVDQARTGNVDAYAALLTRPRARLRRVCLSVLGDGDTAADIAQDAAVVAWLQLDRLRDPSQFGPFLVGIGRNLARDAARERWTRQRWLAPEPPPPEQPSPDADDPAHQVVA